MSSSSAPIRAPFHSLALTVWLIAAVLPSFLTSNPIYLGIGSALIWWTHRRTASRNPGNTAWGSFARFALFFILFTLAFNVLLGGAGTTVLIELPAWTVTDDDGNKLFQVGGAITLESIASAVVRAMALLLVIYALATFNLLADHAQLLRGLPRQLDQAATVISIAISFMPQLVTAQRDIRQALALRGHRARKLKDFVPLLSIMLSEALERAMSLAESMEARGYSGPPMARSESLKPRLLIAGGLLFLGFGAVAGDLGLAPTFIDAESWAAQHGSTVLTLLGALMIVASLMQVGRRQKRTRYRREIWRPRDTGLTWLSTLAGVSLLAFFVLDKGPFLYPIFPTLEAPVADYRILLTLLVIPGLLVFLPAETSPPPSSSSTPPAENPRRENPSRENPGRAS